MSHYAALDKAHRDFDAINDFIREELTEAEVGKMIERLKDTINCLSVVTHKHPKTYEIVSEHLNEAWSNLYRAAKKL